MTKTCSKCSCTKDRTEFYENARQKDGLRSWCKSCFKAYEATRDQELVRAIKRESHHRRKLVVLPRSHPTKVYDFKVAARRKLQYAVRSGKIQRQACACGAPNADAHHDDYSKPLEVRWMCRLCHARTHREAV